MTLTNTLQGFRDHAGDHLDDQPHDLLRFQLGVSNELLQSLKFDPLSK